MYIGIIKTLSRCRVFEVRTEFAPGSHQVRTVYISIYLSVFQLVANHKEV